VIGGLAEIEVADLDEALLLARSGLTTAHTTVWSRSGRWWRSSTLMADDQGGPLPPVPSDEIEVTLSAVFAKKQAG